MNNAEQHIRIVDLERRVTHLVQSLSATDQLAEYLLRRIIMLTHRVRWLEGDVADPMSPNYEALAAEPVAATAGQDSWDSTGLER